VSFSRDVAFEQFEGLLPRQQRCTITTKLNGIIELEGDWEVGLTELSFPSDVENVLDGRCYYTIRVEDQFFSQNNARCETLCIDSRPRSRNEWEAANVDWQRELVCRVFHIDSNRRHLMLVRRHET